MSRDKTCTILGCVSLLHENSKRAFNDLYYEDRPIITGLKKSSMQHSYQSEVLSYFGACTLPAGSLLYHQSGRGDSLSDYYQESSGSGFFSLSATERTPAWRFVLKYDVTIPITFIHHPSLSKNIDVLPEFVAVVMPDTFALTAGHYSVKRGQTDEVGASGARLQMTVRKSEEFMQHLSQFNRRLTTLGFVGWYGADQDGRTEIFIRQNAIKHLLTYDGIQD
jgi:hypothetical protein